MTIIQSTLPMTQKYKRKEMSAVEIDHALALAIGYREQDVRLYFGRIQVQRWNDFLDCCSWYTFDHTSLTVAWPIAARYNCFPTLIDGRWLAETDTSEGWEDTPERAVAMAVIGGAR